MSFEYPEFHSFPPFYTLQPTLSTLEKQLTLWRDLILKYHTTMKIKTLVLHDCVLWENKDIGKRLSMEGVMVVMEDFVKSGHGEWEDSTKTRCKILWRKPTELASDIYDYAVSHNLIGSVITLYELHSGEDVDGESFDGVDEELLRRAVEVLEERGQCKVFKGATSEEDGLKFF